MSFLNPLGLLGLISLPVIIALHAFREREKEQTVSDLSLWSFLDEQVRGSRARRITMTWLLLIDLLIATALSLALAQPRLNIRYAIPSAKHMVLLIDTSTSMLARHDLSDRFSQAKLQANTLLSSLGPRDTATVVAFGRQPSMVGDTRILSPGELIDAVERLQAGETGSGLLEGLALGQTALTPDLPAEFHVFTDAAFPDPGLTAFAHRLEFHVIGRQVPNQAVLEVSTSWVGVDRLQVFTRLANYADQASDRLVSLIADSQVIDSTTLRMEPNSVISQVWSFIGHPSTVVVELAGEDGLKEDDLGAFTTSSAQKLEVGLVAAIPEPVESALRANPLVKLRTLSPDEYIVAMPFDLVVFRGVLPESWPPGELLVLDPPAGSDLLKIDGYAGIAEPPTPTEGDPLAMLDFTGVRWGQVAQVEDLQPEWRIVLQAGSRPLMLRAEIRSSRITVFLPRLDEGNFTGHPTFPIMLAVAVQQVGGVRLPTEIFTGQSVPLPAPSVYPEIIITSPMDEEYKLAGDRPADWFDTKIPGVYRFDLRDNDGAIAIHYLSVNAGQQEEADLTPKSWPDGIDQTDLIESSSEAEQTDLAPFLLGLALLLLILEARLAWR